MNLESHAHPVTAYAEAIAGIEALQARDDGTVNPLCRTTLLTHGAKAPRAIVFLHGFTNCPRQFHVLAQECFEQQFNVLSPRIPYHGLKDRLSAEPARMSAGELAMFTDTVLDLAHGLGEQVYVVGISLGANLVLWAAQQRADLDRAIPIAPVLLPRHVPARLGALLPWLGARLPNRFVWWDGHYKEKLPGPPYAYPRFATRGAAVVLEIAQDVQRRVAASGPRARSVAVVTNANDPAADNRATHALVNRWRARGASSVETYEFEAALGLIHDVVDPEQLAQRTDVVYPVLMKLIGGESHAG